MACRLIGILRLFRALPSLGEHRVCRTLLQTNGSEAKVLVRVELTSSPLKGDGVTEPPLTCLPYPIQVDQVGFEPTLSAF